MTQTVRRNRELMRAHAQEKQHLPHKGFVCGWLPCNIALSVEFGGDFVKALTLDRYRSFQFTNGFPALC